MCKRPLVGTCNKNILIALLVANEQTLKSNVGEKGKKKFFDLLCKGWNNCPDIIFSVF